MRLQTILFPTEDICDVKEMYFHERGEYVDFDGYFNLFQIDARRSHTELRKLFLDIRLKGYKEIIIMNNREEVARYKTEVHELRSYRINLPYEASEGVFWFSLRKSDILDRQIEGFYDGVPDRQRDVDVVIDICTYKREDYVCRNLKKLVELMNDSKLEVSSHLFAYIIDNGKTLSGNDTFLDIVSKQSERIFVFENKNAGGAGGFTRGMIEALKMCKERQFSHIMLMDDDVAFDKDLFVRLYGMLSILKENSKDIIVSGAMLMHELPYRLRANGEWFDHCRIVTENKFLDLRTYDNCIKNIYPFKGKQKNTYPGWWCCCYPFSIVTDDNLPMPFFIHFDDIEYGLRNTRTHEILYLNGISVWHRGLEVGLPGANIYYDVRNNLITTALHGRGKTRRDALRYILKMDISAIIKYKYQDVRLIHKGIVDFCKGPEWIGAQDPEKLHVDIRKMAYTVKSIDAYREQLSNEEYRTAVNRLSKYNYEYAIIMWRNGLDKKVNRLKNKLTFNGWIFPTDKDKITIISSLEPLYATYRKRKVFLMEPGTQRGVLLNKSYIELVRSLRICLSSINMIIKYFYETEDEYKKEFCNISNKGAWKKYLDI